MLYKCVYILFLLLNYNNVNGIGIKCAKHDVNCQEELFGSSNSPNQGNCTVKYCLTNSDTCHNKEFNDITEDNVDLGKVKLQPYYRTYGRPSDFAAFNVTMSDIKWTSLNFRFKADINYEKLPIYKNHCRDILISSAQPLPNSSILYYDCLWTNENKNYDDVTYVFQYQASNGIDEMNGKYVFDIPRPTLVDPDVTLAKWKPFTYVEIKKYQLVLHIVEAPKKFNISHYRIISLHQNFTNDDASISDDDDVLYDVTKKIENDEVIFMIETNGIEGSYFFQVTPLSENCERDSCNMVQTPKIRVVYHKNYIICIASTASVVFSIIICGIFILKHLYLRKYKNIQDDSLLPSPPRIIINYSGVNKTHFQTVTNLVKCLRGYGLIVSYDEDIENTVHRNPFTWCGDEFDKADCFINVVNPQAQLATSYGVHKDVDKMLLKKLENNFAITNKKLIDVMFEYSIYRIGSKPSKNITTIIMKLVKKPFKCIPGWGLRKTNSFRLPSEWRSMMRYICKDSEVKFDLNETDKEELLRNLSLCIEQYHE